MGKYRERFNDKARAGSVAKQERLRKARQKQFHRDEDLINGAHAGRSKSSEEPQIDPNAEILVPLTEEQKRLRRQTLTQELRRQKEPKNSRKRRKRLEAYVQKQIRKEERQIIMNKLDQHKFDSKLLQSSKMIGAGRAMVMENSQKDPVLDEITSDNHDRSLSETDSDTLSETGKLRQAQQIGPRPDNSGSSFIDQRPASGGFTFSLTKKIPKPRKPELSWRQKIELGKRKSAESEDSSEASSSSVESESDSENEMHDDTASVDEVSDENPSESCEESYQEWNGFEESDTDSESSVSSVSEDSEDQQTSGSTGKGRLFREWAENLVQSEKPVVPMYQGYKRIDRPEDELTPPPEEVQEHADKQRVAKAVFVERPEEIQQARLKLPVVGEEQKIMEAIHNNDCVIICGETGSGKTTQIPQFLYEAGFGSNIKGLIGITQPRRVAAVSMAKRVAEELGCEPCSRLVGHQVRFDSKTVNESTRIKFMTDGVLLREMSRDFLLESYSALVIDEAHERNLNTDILIGMLSRVVKSRRAKGVPLKLIIMSATLRVSDFSDNSNLFSRPPPILNVDARQHSVSIHFSKRTSHDYVEDAFVKVRKIHERLPPGGILVFLTGQNEISHLMKKLQHAFPNAQQSNKSAALRLPVKSEIVEAEDIDFGFDNADLASEDHSSSSEEDEEGFEEATDSSQDHHAQNLHVLPLYSLLPTNEQLKVFDPAPPDSRLCILATNVAETSITIPGIRYVVDSGRVKEKHHEETTGVQSYRVTWISQAAAKQRAGRAGRTGPGHCYRLYSSALYEDAFQKFTSPEIFRTPLEGVALQMLSMNIHKIVKFCFPTPPEPYRLRKALELLGYLGATDSRGHISKLGESMSRLPVSPRFAKMILISNQHGCLPYIIAIISALSVGDPFLPPPENSASDQVYSIADREATRSRLSEYYKTQALFTRLDDTSDVLRLLSVICAYDYDVEDKASFCQKLSLRLKSMEEISKLREQLSRIVAASMTGSKETHTAESLHGKLSPPSTLQVKALKQIIAAGYIDQIAIRADSIPGETVDTTAKMTAINTPYKTLFPVKDGHAGAFAYIHPSSIINMFNATPPTYLVYQAVTVRRGIDGKEEGKFRLRPLCRIGPNQLSAIGRKSSLMTYSKPLGPPYGPQTISPTERVCWVVPRFGAAIGTGEMGWDLPVVKIRQRKEGLHWVLDN